MHKSSSNISPPQWLAYRDTATHPWVGSLPDTPCQAPAPHSAALLWDGSALWCPWEHRVLFLPSPTPPELVLTGKHTTLIRFAQQTLALHRTGLVWQPRPTRPHRGDLAQPLPYGAVHSPQRTPFLLGEGLIWRDQGWIYRMQAGCRPEVLGPSEPHERLIAGAHGLLLVVNDERVVRCAAPGRLLTSLEQPPHADAWLRSDTNGMRLAGRDAEDLDNSVLIDTASGHVIAHRADLLPLSTRRWLEPSTHAWLDRHRQRVSAPTRPPTRPTAFTSAHAQKVPEPWSGWGFQHAYREADGLWIMGEHGQCVRLER